MQCTDAGAEMRGVQTTKEYRKIHECPQRCMKTCSGLQENLWESKQTRNYAELWLCPMLRHGFLNRTGGYS